MITHIDLRKVERAGDRAVLLDTYRDALKSERMKLTLAEAAWLYDYSYATLRWYAASGRLKTSGRLTMRRVTHAQMRAYIRGKKKVGSPRKALKARQQKLA